MAMAAATLSSVMWQMDRLLGLLDSSGLSSSEISAVDEALKDLKSILPRIQSAALVAEDLGSIHDTLRSWTRKVTAVAHDAEDVLDDCEHELLLLQRQATGQPEGGEKSVGSSTEEGSSLPKISGIQTRFKEIMIQREVLNLAGEDTGVMATPCITRAPPLPDTTQSAVYGRDDDREKIVQLLLSSAQQQGGQLPVIPIVGDAGIGKTTLCWLVYTDPRICDHFEFRIWASVSQQCCAVDSISGYSYSREIGYIPYLLKWELVNKHFLLVLDDLDPGDPELWHSIREQLGVGGRGSKVLLNSRAEDHLAKVTETLPIKHRLGILPEEGSWALFKKYAFHGREREVNPSIAAVGREIAKKCKGSPLAVKMIGALLYSEKETEEQWENVLGRGLWESMNGSHLSALAFCFRRLPAHLRRCLVYCSLFPRGYPFTRDQLVRLWVAQDFVPTAEGKQMEDVGNDIIDELLRSLFLDHPRIGEEALVMPGLIHDLLKSHLANRYSREGDEQVCSISIEARHASLLPCDTCNKEIQLPSCSKLGSLRTLLLVKRWGHEGDGFYLPEEDVFRPQIPGDFFLLMGHLRSLDLSYSNVEELPEPMEMLKHLRYLSLNYTHIRKLPESMAILRSLQTLELRSCRRLYTLPGSISMLSKLRHLDLHNMAVRWPPQLPDFGKLISLRTLTYFMAWRRTGQGASTVSQLKHLMNLRGEICISGLRDVLLAEEAEEAQLSNKEHLEKLTLKWCLAVSGYDPSSCGDWLEDAFSLFDEEFVTEVDAEKGREEIRAEERWIYDISSAVAQVEKKKGHLERRERHLREANRWFREEVFESLRPHPNLRHLVIEGYDGVRLPGWMGDPSFSKLVSLTLLNCYQCRTFPPGLGQLPALKHLTMKFLGLKKQKQDDQSPEPIIMNGFLSLECLEVEHMPWWEGWCCPEDGSSPKLRSLTVYGCPRLKRLPQCLPSLTEMALRDCEQLTDFPTAPSLVRLDISLRGSSDGKAWVSWLGGLTTLQSLSICCISDLTDAPLQQLCALKRLVISSSPWVRAPPFLVGLHRLAVLQRLEVRSCKELCLLPDERLPSTLKALHIAGCPLLRDWCLQHRSKLAHISRITLDGSEYDLDQHADATGQPQVPLEEEQI